MRPWLCRAVAISLCLVSCAAKNAPTRIKVKVAETYSGAVHLSPCVQNVQDLVLLDEKGNGKTSACPLGADVELLVVKGANTIFIPREQITIARAGDGLPVTITAAIP